MKDYSQETLRRIGENVETLIELGICNDDLALSSGGRYFKSTEGGDYSRLGSCVKRNTNLKILFVKLEDIGLSATDSGFFEGIKQNSSIDKFKLSGYSGNIPYYRPLGYVGCELLKAFQENSSNLIDLRIWCCDISSIDERIIINTTLSSCTNLQTLHFNYNNMTAEQLLPMVEAIRGHQQLKGLSLPSNRIGNVGCETLATLLADPNCNLLTLDLHNNEISEEGAIAIANSLTNKNKLKKLDLSRNQMGDQSIVEDAFSRVLCNTTSINSIHSSNHTLETLIMNQRIRQLHDFRLQQNEETNKNQVAIRKILLYHPNIEMEPLYGWGSEDEWSLKALPYVIGWFDRAREAVANDDGESYDVDAKALSAIYHFTKDMPLMFIPSCHNKADDKKRKRG